jgi:hypothetical protein
VAHDLQLPWNVQYSATIVNPAVSLIETSKSWNMDRFALRKEPGTVRLDATSAETAQYFDKNGANALQSTSLALVRAVDIAAVRVNPSPLPSKSGVLLLPPVTSVQVGVTVVNDSYDNQPITFTVQVIPLNNRGASFSQRMTTTLGPMGAFAFVPKILTTVPSEQARIIFHVIGARAAVGKLTTETFRLEMSPSGNTAPG